MSILENKQEAWHILHANSEIGTQLRGAFCFSICLRHLNRSRAVTNLTFCSNLTYFPS